MPNPTGKFEISLAQLTSGTAAGRATHLTDASDIGLRCGAPYPSTVFVISGLGEQAFVFDHHRKDGEGDLLETYYFADNGDELRIAND